MNDVATSHSQTDQDWHSVDTDTVLARLNSSATGLSHTEAERRLTQFGPNRLPTTKARSPLRRLLAQFNNLLIQVLLLTAAITALLGHWVDTWVILGVVLVNAAIGFIQEGRAEQALAAIRHMLAPRAAVSRDGHRRNVAAEQLVPGDVVLLEPGDKVPADLRLLRAKGLRIHALEILGIGVALFALLELEKWARRTRQRRSDSEAQGEKSVAFLD